MRSILRWLLPLGVAGAVAAGVAHAQTASSSATVTWPPPCTKVVTCVNNHLEALDVRLRALSAREAVDRARIAKLRAFNSTLATCLAEYPTTKRGVYDGYQSWVPDLLQQTQSGWSVDLWIVRDACTPGVFNRPLAP